ncbi:hydrolase [Cytobacillus oceanisediminis]|uniref:Hydrolase n=2 Tax=Niallia TaxID=2837506 RepID=A0A941GMI4_NIACI|nr:MULTISPECIES: hydrolase [Bacillaceae]EOR21934.1 hydrolase [Niallia nealsonii AAU1]MBQ6448624.1 hydrolase [Bacillus sp. (in: firmicutes)]MDU1845435.1 hydrolase [Niallia nealsonii]MBZ9533115.1 hydrolase [Cytobacillus oceanisediminis]MCB5236723.1 hydrolase [Niallia circulans]
MENRNFQLDTEWNMIHYPHRPNGFGILIIGDERNFVTDTNSFWNQNEGKRNLIESLRDNGYTIFYSNLYGKNWGSEKALQLARRLYEHIIRTEILNQRIHIIAEGMGALTAIRLMMEMKDNIRSVVLLNPILSLKEHLEREKEHKFFIKKLTNEISIAFNTNKHELFELVKEKKEYQLEETDIPTKIIQILHNGRSYYQSHGLKKASVIWEEKNLPIFVSYVLPEKRSAIPKQIASFFKKYEKTL